MGETGTGKELAAQAVHKHSARAAAPFVAVNCAAIPDSLFESELFGYERGAFTGAHARHEGKLAQANGGTVFLDEIGDMSPYAQAKLLRAVEDRRVERLGGNGGISVNVRVVAATNQPLERMVGDGRFRRDLYFRLGVTRVTLPPLRERLEDLASLAAHFLKQLNRAMGRSLTRFAPDAAALLAQYDWPGNVREFRNLIEAVAVEKYTGEIGSRDLPEWFTALVCGSSAPPAERDRIMDALESSRWNKSKAASRLRWSRMTLYRKMAQYSISGGGADIVEQVQNNQAKPDNRSACANCEHGKLNRNPRKRGSPPARKEAEVSRKSRQRPAIASCPQNSALAAPCPAAREGAWSRHSAVPSRKSAFTRMKRRATSQASSGQALSPSAMTSSLDAASFSPGHRSATA